MALSSETVSLVKPHETVFVRGGGGTVQNVPWNVPGFGDSAMFGAFGLTEDETQQLAERVKAAFLSTDVEAILSAIPTLGERQAVATRALAIGADPGMINLALQNIASNTPSKIQFNVPLPWRIFWGVASTVSTGLGAYHGYKRNSSIGWAIWWGLMGGIFPIVTPAIAFAQGFGKPRHAGFGRARLRPYRGRSRRRRS
jgi:hypothetical protein